MTIAIVTCLDMPEPDFDEYDMLAAFARHGVSVEMAAWDDPAIDWSGYRRVLLRSTWNYWKDQPAFVQWIKAVGALCPLDNPADVVVWNSHKTYLGDLEDAGIRVVPTLQVPQGSGAEWARAEVSRRGWEQVVVKPAVSAGSYRTWRSRVADLIDEKFEQLLLDRDAMIQPWVASVEGWGERAIVMIDGALTHAVRKEPRFLDMDESVSEAMAIAPDEAELANQVLDHVNSRFGLERWPLYGRVDVARDASNQPMIMELELIEPSLFFKQNPDALERYVTAVRSR